jgi:hypothetical protein
MDDAQEKVHQLTQSYNGMLDLSMPFIVRIPETVHAPAINHANKPPNNSIQRFHAEDHSMPPFLDGTS